MKALPLVFIGQSLIMAGVYFTSGRLMTAQLAEVYARAGMGWRTVVVSATIFPLANFLFGCAFAHFTPAVVSPTMIAMTVVTQILFTVMVPGTRPGL